MPTGIVLYALMIIAALIVWEVIRAAVKKAVNKEYVEKKDFQEFQKECIECRRRLPIDYVTSITFKGAIERLENIHREDVVSIYNTMKGGFESVAKRIDDFLNKH